MTARELSHFIDKEVVHFDRRYHERSVYILRGIKKDAATGKRYTVLQDISVKNSYVKARIEDIERVE